MPGKETSYWKWICVGLVLLCIFSSWFFLPIDQWVKSFNGWVKELGIGGYFLFGAVYAAATVLLVPGSVLTLGAGLAFGLWAVPLVVVSATIGASLAFLVAKYLARAAIEKRFGNDERFKAIDAAVSEDGWKVVGLLRLSPLVPFNLQNYFYGLTNINFWHYVAATFIGIMPGSLMYVYFGAVGRAALDDGGRGSNPIVKWSLFGAGLVATIVATVLVASKAKAKLGGIGVSKDQEEKAQEKVRAA